MAMAGGLTAEMEIRPPGEAGWLAVEVVDVRRNVDPPEVYLTAGGRQFHTKVHTYWPARMVDQ